MPTEAWRQLVNSIDTQLTTGDDWPMLARAIQDVHVAGHDVTHELRQLAFGRQISTRQPAAELAYRLRAATLAFSYVEPTRGHAQKPGALSSSARSDPQPSRRAPDRPER